jgi:hypothetical protein
MKPRPIELFALSNFMAESSGVDGAVVWVAAGEFGGVHEGRGPRVMVVPWDHIAAEPLTGAVAVTLAMPPEVLGALACEIRKKVVRFVDANREVLLRHWRGEIDTREMIDGIRSGARR